MLFSCAVTYQSSQGGFADRFLGYIHAKWVSYTSGVPLLYRPFLYADTFALHEFEELNIPYNSLKFYELGQSWQPSTLYIIPYFSECHDDWQFEKILQINWKDSGFIELLRKSFRPRQAYPKIPLSSDFINVAVHMRRGGVYEKSSDVRYFWPLRFAPDSYYIEALRILCSHFPNQKIYAHIFTDDLEPGVIIDRLVQTLHDLPIVFGGKREGNGGLTDIEEDFIAMMDFDCLIRSQSNFSFIPAKIAGYKLVITPKHVSWRLINGYTVENYIDEIDVEVF